MALGLNLEWVISDTLSEYMGLGVVTDKLNLIHHQIKYPPPRPSRVKGGLGFPLKGLV